MAQYKRGLDIAISKPHGQCKKMFLDNQTKLCKKFLKYNKLNLNISSYTLNSVLVVFILPV